MTNLDHSSPSLSWRSRWTWRAGETKREMQLSSTMVRDCLFAMAGDLAHLFPRCSLRDLLLEEEHGHFRHFSHSEFDVKEEALFIQAIEREMWGASRWSMEKGQGGMVGNWVAGRDLCERLLEMPAKQGMRSFARLTSFSLLSPALEAT